MEKEGWGWATNVVHDVSPLSQVTTDDSLCKVIAKIDIKITQLRTFEMGQGQQTMEEEVAKEQRAEGSLGGLLEGGD